MLSWSELCVPGTAVHEVTGKESLPVCSQTYSRCEAAAQNFMAIRWSEVGGMRKKSFSIVQQFCHPLQLSALHQDPICFFQINMKEQTKEHLFFLLVTMPWSAFWTTGNVLYRAMNPTIQGNVYIVLIIALTEKATKSHLYYSCDMMYKNN